MPKSFISYDLDIPEIPGRSPYTKPDAYLEKLGEGKYTIHQGRRPSGMFLVDKLRQAVDEWRDAVYPGISTITRRLLQFWFEEDHLLSDGHTVWRYWWCQREALETLVFLTEVRGFSDLVPLASAFGDVPKLGMLEMGFSVDTSMDGDRKLHRWLPEVQKEATQELPEENLLRYAFKMATGSGKTLVMAMVIVWSYYHRRMVSGSKLTDNFLIVAPNIIVFERLERDFANNKVFHEMPLIPPEWLGEWGLKVILRGESAQPDPSGNLFLVNIQQIYESREQEWTPSNAVDAILGQPAKQDLAAYQPSMLERIKTLDNLIVLNDEAHHVHDDDLEWNKTLLALHENLKHKTGHGLTLWLDFSATPKSQSGTYFPWIITDYPLAQAIEDKIVKAPLIVHQVNRKDPKKVTRKNVVRAYDEWITVALNRWKEHTQTYRRIAQKPVLFIMCERTVYADVIAEHIRKQAGMKKSEVLVIHTDTKGNLTDKHLNAARQAARDVDKADSDVKIIVSVMMLREGWDVRNVTVILGLRPFTSKARILPEQAVGRGLRIMPNISPDSRQTLEVIGTQAFEDFVRQLEEEGVGIETTTKPPTQPITIYPVMEKIAFDIAIPLTKPKYTHEYRNLDELDPLSLDPIYDADVLAEEFAIAIKIDFTITETTVHQAVVVPDRPLMSQEFLADISNAIAGRIALSGHFASVYSIVKRYVQHRCFGVEVVLDSKDIMRRLRDPMLQEGIVIYLSRKIAELATQEHTIEFEQRDFKLSQTAPFVWRRQHLPCKKTIFFECAVFNPLEARFAQFLEAAPDVLRFAALAESYTRFRVDYLSTTGAIRFYYPDFVAVQRSTDGEVNWIIETKGREYEEVENKDAAIREWCQKISAQTGQDWRYLKVSQSVFDRGEWKTLDMLAQAVAAGESQGAMFAL